MTENCKVGPIPANAKHLYSICTTSAQRLRRWSNIVQMLCKCLRLLVYAELSLMTNCVLFSVMEGFLTHPINAVIVTAINKQNLNENNLTFSIKHL